MKQKSITREILFTGLILIVLALGYLTILFIGNKRHNNLDALKSKKEVLVERFEKIEPFQKLWYELRKKKRFNEDYNDFVIEYGEIQRSEILFNLTRNNDLFEGNLNDFCIKYYRHQSALKDSYELDKFETLEFKVFCDSIMTNESFTKNKYDIFILQGYNGSLNNFIKLMRGKRKNNEYLSYSSIKNIEADIEMNKMQQDRIKNSIFYYNSGNLIE